MKKKQLIISLSLAIAVLFSILFQSFDSYEHIVKQLSEKECVHEYNKHNHTEITHQHHVNEVCYVCHFAFSTYITPQKFVFQVVRFTTEIPYSFLSLERVNSFSGSLYSHRGPPIV